MNASRRCAHVCVSWSGTGSIIISSGERMRRYADRNPRGERATALTPAASASTVSPVPPVASPSPAAPASPPTVAPPLAAPPVSPVTATVPGKAPSVRLQFEREAWVEIKQADGKVLLYGQQKAGSEAQLSLVTELSLLIGNADHVRVDRDGKPVDIKSLARQGVARLKLNP